MTITPFINIPHKSILPIIFLTNSAHTVNKLPMNYREHLVPLLLTPVLMNCVPKINLNH